MKTITLDRGKLLTGAALKELAWLSSLQHTCGLQCCLGQYGVQIGYDPATYSYMSYLTGVRMAEGLPEEAAWLRKSVSPFDAVKAELIGDNFVEQQLAIVNDSDLLSDAEREAKITQFFKDYGGIEINWIGDYADGVEIAKAYQRELEREEEEFCNAV